MLFYISLAMPHPALALGKLALASVRAIDTQIRVCVRIFGLLFRACTFARGVPPTVLPGTGGIIKHFRLLSEEGFYRFSNTNHRRIRAFMRPGTWLDNPR
jgi:hypothetical protein